MQGVGGPACGDDGMSSFRAGVPGRAPIKSKGGERRVSCPSGAAHPTGQPRARRAMILPEVSWSPGSSSRPDRVHPLAFPLLADENIAPTGRMNDVPVREALTVRAGQRQAARVR